MQKRMQKAVKVSRPGRFVSFKPLENRSLEAYKAYIRAIGAALGGSEVKDDMTEEEWRRDWEMYWGYRDAVVRGEDTGLLQ